MLIDLITYVFIGGDWYLLGIQTLTCVCLASWSMITSILLLWGINKIVTIRMEVHYELLGADLTEHHIKHGQVSEVRVSCHNS